MNRICRAEPLATWFSCSYKGGEIQMSEMGRVQSNSMQASNVRWMVLGIDVLLLALNYGDRAIIGVAAPLMMQEFDISSSAWGIILSAFFFGYAPFCFIGGWTSDKFGPRKIMGWAAAWWSVFTALTVVGYNFISFVILRCLFGFGEGPQGSVMTKLVGNWFPQRETGTAIGIAQAATPLGGAIVTPIVVWLLAMSNGNWRTPFLVLGAVGLVLSVVWFIVVRDKPEQHPWISQKELDTIRNGYLARRPEFAADGETLSVLQYIKKPYVLSTAIAFFGYAWVLYTFLGWFPVYLIKAHGINIKDLAISASIPWITGTIGTVLGGVITDWIGRKTGKPAAARKWFIVVCLLLVGIAFAPIATISTLFGAVTLMSIVSFLLYLTCAQYFSFITDTVPSARLGGVMGFVHFIANTAGIFAPAVTGFLYQATNSWVMGFGAGAVIVVAGALCMAAFCRTEVYEQQAREKEIGS